ncbi:MAG: hypothetical protein V4687_01715 [Bacteroidota bacterium]
MSNKTKFTEELKRFEQLEGNNTQLLSKLDELIILLEKSDLDSENIREIKVKINKTLDQKLVGKSLIKEVKDVATSNLDKMDQLDKLELLLTNNHFDSADAKKINIKLGISRFIRGIIGLLFVTLGFAMIIMPAPPYFEMFTVFYFNPNDGVTLMDLISLIIVAVGIYIMINALLNLKNDE